MNRGLVKLSQIVPCWESIAREQMPAPMAAPQIKPPRVIGDPTRTPVNRQAALLTARAAWIYQPLPPEPPRKPKIEELQAKVALLESKNSALISENAALKRKLEAAKARSAKVEKPKSKMDDVTPKIPTHDPRKELLEWIQKTT